MPEVHSRKILYIPLQRNSIANIQSKNGTRKSCDAVGFLSTVHINMKGAQKPRVYNLPYFERVYVSAVMSCMMCIPYTSISIVWNVQPIISWHTQRNIIGIYDLNLVRVHSIPYRCKSPSSTLCPAAITSMPVLLLLLPVAFTFVLPVMVGCNDKISDTGANNMQL